MKLIQLIRLFFEWNKLHNTDDFLHNMPFTLMHFIKDKNGIINYDNISFRGEITRFWTDDNNLFVVLQK